VARAKVILAELERGDRGGSARARLDDLPLFSARPAPPPQPVAPEPAADAVRAALDALDPDELTPRAALDALYALKRARAQER
jgi:DNA mismatch repair protein MutS